jgi:hypothetical protein
MRSDSSPKGAHVQGDGDSVGVSDGDEDGGDGVGDFPGLH